MLDLLCAGRKRYLCNVFTYVFLLLGSVIGIYEGLAGQYELEFTHNPTGQQYHVIVVDDFYFFIYILLFSAFLCITIGREHSDGTIRNKIICGHTKIKVIVSELIMAILYAAAAFVCTMLPFFLVSAKCYVAIPLWEMVKIALCFLLIYIAGAVIAAVLAMCIDNRAIAVTVTFGVMMGLYVGGSIIDDKLNAPQYLEITSYDEEGQEAEEKESEKQKVPNDKYIANEAVRGILSFLNRINPEMNLYYSCEYISSSDSIALGVVGLLEECSQRENQFLSGSAGFILMIFALGVCIFGRKDLK